MQQYQRDFIDFALARQALRFGEFTLKSGRISPYFFNAGHFNTGECLARLGQAYAQALLANPIPFDMLFGPAYKGIPLAAATAIALADRHQQSWPFAFNRKEAKDHGEGGMIVGAELKGRVMIVDDVITAGTAVREVFDIIRNAGAEPAGVLVALDRQERGKGELSAIQEIQRDVGIPVISIISLDQILGYLQKDAQLAHHAPRVAEYRQTYGV